MDIIKKNKLAREIKPEDVKIGAELEFNCCVHKIKKRSGFTFVYLRTGKYIFTAVHNPKYCEKPLRGVFEGVYINAKCVVREEKRGENGIDITITDYSILSKPTEKYPMPVSDKSLDCSPEEIAENRAVSGRHPVERMPFRVFSCATEGLSKYMSENEFLRITTPAVTTIATEAEKDVFSVPYFGKEAYLVSDSSLYCQSTLAYFDRVYEISKVFFGKKRNSPRLLSEYTTLNFEISYIADKTDIMACLISAIEETCGFLKDKCSYEFENLGATLPEKFEAPSITFNEAMQMLKKEESQPDLDPTDEKRISDWAEKEFGSEFVFVTGLPEDKRPFYYKEGENFVLLFRGMEIASGGEKITDYNEAVQKGVPEALCDFYKYGMPPHGGAGLGIERFVMKLLNLNDIRQASLFPRDMHILIP